jgi:hydroxyethylthiazole kinase
MIKAVIRAEKKVIPVILDPVGAGATSYRTKTALEIIEKAPPAVIRGNASEIMALWNGQSATRGVDSAESSDSAIVTAQKLSATYHCVVCVSGATDYIIENDKIVKVKNGHPLMTKVTGMGCTASALCGAFAAEEKAFPATAKAMAVMGIAGEMAAQKAAGPGSLQMHFLDILYNLSQADIGKHLRIEE